ncbi:MAG: glycosyltransferase [Candidatus Paceibacterota bacterium]|jgi:glycosyltransferase involved in cell wall biosynthesis
MKISIVTPAYNMEEYVSQTMESVLSQRGDFDIEYIIVNDGSTDSTEKIILNLKNRLDKKLVPIFCNSVEIKYIAQENQGMYSAINNGFVHATGDIYAWIGADDLYKPDTAFESVVEWFTAHPESQWAKGMCGLLDTAGRILRHGKHRAFYRDWLVEGIYGRETFFVEQESVFWRKELWAKIDEIPRNYRSAGDYWLWIEFAKYAPLDSIPTQVAYFRRRPGQISSNKKKYGAEQQAIAPRRSGTAFKVRIFSILTNYAPFLYPLWGIMYRLAFPGKRLYR